LVGKVLLQIFRGGEIEKRLDIGQDHGNVKLYFLTLQFVFKGIISLITPEHIILREDPSFASGSLYLQYNTVRIIYIYITRYIIYLTK